VVSVCTVYCWHKTSVDDFLLFFWPQLTELCETIVALFAWLSAQEIEEASNDTLSNANNLRIRTLQ
jgi:hypothetical protein